jgi:starch-binding outer membrane protein, SusD/RagB family
MKTLRYTRPLIIVIAVMVNSCTDEFLEVTPNGGLDESVLATEEGLDALLIGAYSLVDGVSANGFGWEATTSNWFFGSVMGGEANKGSDAGDQSDMNPLYRYQSTAQNAFLNVKWRAVYEGVSRSNAVLSVLKKMPDLSDDKRNSYEGQAKALRGFYHFEAKRMWNMVPYVDENTTANDVVANDKDIWPMIEADFEFAYNNLPENMEAVGRINKWVAGAFLSKVYVYQKKFDEALPILKAIIDQGKNPLGVKYALLPKYGDVFDIVNRNSSEAVFTVQFSVNDGSGGWNGGWGEVLNFPYKSGGSPGGCCGFFQPNQEFVNSFRTQAGLPMLDGSYNDPANELPSDMSVNASASWGQTSVYYEGQFVTRINPAEPYRERVYRAIDDMDGNANEQIVNTDPLASPATWELVFLEPSDFEIDPRLDWTVGRRGLPYLDWGDHTGSDWIRDPAYGGPYSPKKQVYKKSQEGVYTEVGNWTSGWTANGYRMIRFAEILLLAAECEVEIGSLEQARDYVNQVRQRAANPEGFVKNPDNTPAANYAVTSYPSGSPFDSKENAQKAVYFERKLELGMEGHRFFDLARWGIAEGEIASFIAYEGEKRSGMYQGVIFEPADIYFPIPQRQIDLSNGALVQTRN